MASMTILSLKQGEERHKIAITSAPAEKASGDVVMVAVSSAVMTKAEALDQIEKIKERIISGPWPIA